jgi:hypothetical protein
MNAQLKHRIAGQRGARKTKLHVKLLIADRFRERARSRDAIAGRGAYLLPRRNSSQRYSTSGQEFTSAMLRSHARVTVRHPRVARKLRSLGAL